MTESTYPEKIEPFVPKLLPGNYERISPEKVEVGMTISALYDPIETRLRRYRTGQVVEMRPTTHGDSIVIEDKEGRITLLQPWFYEGAIIGYDVFDKTESKRQCIGELLSLYSKSE